MRQEPTELSRRHREAVDRIYNRRPRTVHQSQSLHAELCRMDHLPRDAARCPKFKTAANRFKKQIVTGWFRGIAHCRATESLGARFRYRQLAPGVLLSAF